MEPCWALYTIQENKQNQVAKIAQSGTAPRRELNSEGVAVLKYVYQIHQKSVKKWYQHDAKITPKILQRAYQKWPQNYPNMTPKRPQSDPKDDPNVTPKWYQTDTNVTPRWLQIDLK